MTELKNTILGINISHDTSIAVVHNGELVDVFEEERCRRSKYWSPSADEEIRLQSIEQKINVDSIDEVVFASFDRRAYDYNVPTDLPFDRIRTREFRKDFTETQTSRERLKELAEKWEMEFNFWPNTDDQKICDDIATSQLGLPKGEYYFKQDHHVHHAWCGFNLAPMEEALIIVMDGGGCRKLWDEYPTHQEIESIYYGIKSNATHIEPLYQKLTNQRFICDMSDKFPNELDAFLHCPHPQLYIRDGVDYELVSTPSMGMNFSNISQALGTDKLGRAAGKVMGMASYGHPLDNYYNRYNIAHQLELDSFEYTCELIRRAIKYKPDCKNIILSGGFSLNCTNNYKYLYTFPEYQIFVDPIPHDGGTAAGAALQMYEEMRQGNNQYCKPSVWSDS
tara:strand:+ start:658 stop:1839 length:1182 start_codon:yes stop_codon:yes gene_type:complete